MLDTTFESVKGKGDRIRFYEDIPLFLYANKIDRSKLTLNLNTKEPFDTAIKLDWSAVRPYDVVTEVEAEKTEEEIQKDACCS